MTGSITLIHILLSGFFVHRLLKPGPSSRLDLLEDLPAICGMGALASFLFFLCASWIGNVSIASLSLWVIFLGLVCYLLRSNACQQQRPGILPPDLLVFFVLGLYIAFNLALTIYLPILDWDTRILWALKSKMLTLEPTVAGEAFRDPYLLHIHPRYPLLVPFLASWIARLHGEFIETHYQVLISIFSFLTFWQLYLLLSRLAERTSAIILSAIMACTGAWISAQYNSGIEIPLTFFLVLSVTCLIEWLAERRTSDILMAAMFLFGMAMVKNEGLLLAASIVIALCAVLLLEHTIRAAFCSAGLLAAVFLVLSSVWFAHLVSIPDVSDEQYLSRLTQAHVMNGLHRFPIIISTVMAMLGDLRQWHLLWLAPCAAGLHVIRRRAAVDRRLLFLCIVAGCYVSGLLLIYIISPWRDIALHIAVSFDRVALPLIPLFTMMITLAALDVRSDPHTFSHGDGRRQTGTPNLPDLE